MVARSVLAAALVVLTGPAVHGQEVASRLFLAADRDRDGVLTRAELAATLGGWEASSPDQLHETLDRTLPLLPQNQTPRPADVEAMRAALPDKAPAKPLRPRRVLVLGKALGYVHASIPLAARTIEEMGRKTGAWATTVTYDPADVNARTLAPYDALVLASTSGDFLDDPQDAAVTAARRKALLDFVRGGKGLAGLHAATVAYFRSRPVPGAPRIAYGAPGTLAKALLAQGDRDGDRGLTRNELHTLAEAWYDRLDADHSGRVDQAAFPQRFTAILPLPPPSTPAPLGPNGFPVQGPAKELGPDPFEGTWPEFNRLIGGLFKFHWNDGQVVTVKIDEPDHPLNAPFKGQPPLRVRDETYTFAREVYSRRNVRVLTSVDYAAMSAEDKAKEQYPRSDHDHPLSWIRREGQGRVFYEAHGHNEKVYAIQPLLAHILHGMQYVLGDLEVDDRPRP